MASKYRKKRSASVLLVPLTFHIKHQVFKGLKLLLAFKNAIQGYLVPIIALSIYWRWKYYKSLESVSRIYAYNKL